MERLTGSPAALAVHRRINRTAVPYPSSSPVHELFEHVVRLRPDATAVLYGDRRLSYRSLNGLANDLASDLIADGMRPGDVVAVVANRSPELIAGLIAVLKCGGAYLPVEPSWPDARLRLAADQTNCRHVLAAEPDQVASRLPGRRVLPLGGTGHEGPRPDPKVAVGPDSIAYLNFTSGSTGRPKAVMVPHRAVVRLVRNARYAPLDDRAVVLHIASIAFDASTFEIWGPLLNGGTCVLYPSAFVRTSELKRVVTTTGVTATFLTSSLFNVIIDEAPDALDTVDTILVGGEALSVAHVAKALGRYGPGHLVNAYGPTECTTFAAYHPVREIMPDLSALPIGLPIQNTRAYVVHDERLRAPGQIGELWLAGPGLAAGYLGEPDLTRQCFVEREVDGVQERLYRTGDRSYLLHDGTIVFLGRSDDQIKISGYRVELGEISFHLDRHPDVRQSFVTTVRDALGERRLVAFVVPWHGSCGPDAVRTYLRQHLPEYAVPATIVIRDALPLAASGKVDRHALFAEHTPA